MTSNVRVLLGAAALLAVGSGAVFGIWTWRLGHAAPPATPIVIPEKPYAAAATEVAPIKSVSWDAPSAQSRGRDWVFDTFTPPEIFYHPRSKQFTVKPPASLLDEETEEAFGLELVAVRPQPFRLQLIGFVGGPGNWRGTFENLASGETFLASSGRRVPNLSVTIESLDVQPQAIVLPESMTTRQLVATAMVRDELTGRTITLTHRERRFTDTNAALVAAPGETTAREVRAGDTLKVGEATYRIDKVQLNPAAVEVTKESAHLSQPDHRTLTPRETEANETSESSRS
jgi:hypothetical protein